MIIVYISGGLGNQMFQYAFSTGLKKYTDKIKYDTTVYDYQKIHDGFVLENIFGIDCERATKKEIKNFSFYESNKFSKIPRKIFGPKKSQIIEKGFFEGKLAPYKKFEIYDNKYYQGYWQSYKYFDDCLIQKQFIFKKILNEKNNELKNNIENNPEKYCAIHIRRGDYITSGYTLFKNISSTSYYNNAINKVFNINKNIRFLVFSDDINWVKNNMNIPNACYIDWNKGKDSYVDMQLMSLCKYIIMANSTFSWWAAYLNPNNIHKKIYTPNEWFNTMSVKDIDLLLDEWIKIDIK